MVTEWGMSAAVGPMSLADGGPVFLGEDMMQSRSHSPDTARLVDDEVRRILVEAEDGCRNLITEYRNGLDLIARALLEHETISGTEVSRLIDVSKAGPVVVEPEAQPAEVAGLDDA